MDDGLMVLLDVFINAVGLVLSGLITYLSFRAYRRTGSRDLQLFTLGVALLTVRVLIGGGLHQLLGAALLTGVLVQSVLTALGLVTLVCSLYVDESEKMISSPP